MIIDTAKLAGIQLGLGQHPRPTSGLCLLEAVAYLVGEKHSDHPEYVSPVLGEFGRDFNDSLPDDARQHLKSVIPLLPGTNDGQDAQRRAMVTTWLVREWTPRWLELVPQCRDDARVLRELPNWRMFTPRMNEALDLAARRATSVARLVRSESKFVDTQIEAESAIRSSGWNAAHRVTMLRAEQLHAVFRAAVNAAWVAVGTTELPTLDLRVSALDLFAAMAKAPEWPADVDRDTAARNGC